jgi:threonine/homoserine efflux transporter RhtA
MSRLPRATFTLLLSVLPAVATVVQHLRVLEEAELTIVKGADGTPGTTSTSSDQRDL